MNKEIERKFLIKKIPKGLIGTTLRQGYLQSEKQRAVRIRTVEKEGLKKGFLTIKGVGNSSGMSRYEFEAEIPIADADYLLNLCDQPIIEKTRYIYEHESLIWEIDDFHGVNDGLVIAEVELKSEDQEIKKPDFVDKEVTGQKKYYNLMLTKNPYSLWEEESLG